jgi:hypothetical protein
MSSGKYEEFNKEMGTKSSGILTERDVDMSKIVIPFSKAFKSFEQPDIYSGDEKIPFKERDPEYRMILRQEFANVLKEEI